jgi:predicted nucleotidyltransferase
MAKKVSKPRIVFPRRRYLDGAQIPMRVIRRYARRVADRFQPDRIILFGSQAYGTPNEDSDVDILVIMPARDVISQAVKIRWEFPAPFAMDLLVRSPETMRRRLEQGSSFLKEIVTQGIVLYEKRDATVGKKGRNRSAHGRPR